ncbi:MAG: DUF1553 domain-containing protein, partial [Verrucomicrobiota bacterium]
QAEADKAGGETFTQLRKKVEELKKKATGKVTKNPAFGWHSRIVKQQDTVKWVQVDLEQPTDIEKIVLRPCHDEYNNIGAGFGFPLRFKIEAATDPDFKTGVTLLADETMQNFGPPGLTPYTVSRPVTGARYLRVTATRLAPRSGDFIFALAELEAFDRAGKNIALGKPVQSLDSIQAPVRWARKNLTDGHYAQGGHPEAAGELAEAEKQFKALREKAWTEELKARRRTMLERRAEVDRNIKALPKPELVYAATTQFKNEGQFKPTGGKPRMVRILNRGNVTEPQTDVQPGTFPLIDGVDWEFKLPEGHVESDRRVALARWLTRTDHPLTWRSIVNRVWLWHFGRALVDSPNDFGRMGQLPSHPELLDWLAVDFRDGGQTLKRLHKMMVMSSTWQQ